MIKYYRNCDELPKWNFDQVSKSNDLRFLVHGYDGWGDAKTPDNIQEVWANIIEEYAHKTKNNKTVRYFELVMDINDMRDRAYYVEIILTQLVNRYSKMPKEVKQEYLNELRKRRFYFNESRLFKDEIERLDRQLKVVKMKIKQKNEELESFKEKNFGGEEVSTLQMLVNIKEACNVNIDLKSMSVSEWLLWIDKTLNKKAA